MKSEPHSCGTPTREPEAILWPAVTAICDRFGVKETTARTMIRNGEIETVRLRAGGKISVSEAELRRKLASLTPSKKAA